MRYKIRIGNHFDSPPSTRTWRSGFRMKANMVRSGFENAVAVYCAFGVTGDPQVHVGTYRILRAALSATAAMTPAISNTTRLTGNAATDPGRFGATPSTAPATALSGPSASIGTTPRSKQSPPNRTSENTE